MIRLCPFCEKPLVPPGFHWADGAAVAVWVVVVGLAAIGFAWIVGVVG